MYGYNTTESKKLDVVIPIIPRDFEKITANLPFIQKHIQPENIILIGPTPVAQLVNHNNRFEKSIKLHFIDENELIYVKKVKKLCNCGRSGWYIQQFIKMQYSKICTKPYYLIWDADTMPLKNIQMFNDSGKPFFDVKTEYHRPYFITMKKLLPDLGKQHNFSFISEHMIVRKQFMNELIDKIQSCSSIKGDSWYEKVINAIDSKDLRKSGFSEFETYGTFVQKYYPQVYEIRKWKSLRVWNGQYKARTITEKDITLLSKNYDAVSFER